MDVEVKRSESPKIAPDGDNDPPTKGMVDVVDDVDSDEEAQLLDAIERKVRQLTIEQAEIEAGREKLQHVGGWEDDWKIEERENVDEEKDEREKEMCEDENEDKEGDEENADVYVLGGSPLKEARYNNLSGGRRKVTYPIRSDAEDCAYYMKYWSCKFESNCKFNHPPRRRTQGIKERMKTREENSEREGQIECKYYLSEGGCKCGKDCKYANGTDQTAMSYTLELNFLGLRIRLTQSANNPPTAALQIATNRLKNQPHISTMKVMVATQCRYSSILEQREVKIPEIKNNDVMIKVYAVGVNRGDIIDVAKSDHDVCPGLECSGIIKAIGRNVNCWKVGERVCAILEGGGYAEQVAVPADFLLPVPDDIDLHDAAGLPYASSSIWSALFKMHDHRTLKDKTILIREGTSGIGSLAIQYAKYMGLKVIASTGSSDKFSICHAYGAGFCVDHTSIKFVRSVEEKTGNRGVDFVLDYGASDLLRNIKCCDIWGKVVVVDLHGAVHGGIDVGRLQTNQIQVKGFDLRFRNSVYKASVIAEVRTHLWPAVLQKKVVPVIEHRFPVIEAQKAWSLLKKNDSIGKIILDMNFEVITGHLKTD